MNAEGFFLIVILIIVALIGGCAAGERGLRVEAVKNGAAHYSHSPDKPDGDFTWGPAK